MAVSKISAVFALAVLTLASFTHANCDFKTRNQWGASEVDDLDMYTTASPAVIVQQIRAPRMASCTNVKDCYKLVKAIQQYFLKTLKVGDIPCNFLIGGDGSAYEGRGWGVESNLGQKVVMCVIGEFEEKAPTSGQISQLKEIIKCGVDSGKIGSNYKVQALRDVNSDSDNPGDKLYREIKKLSHYSSS